MVRKNLNNFYGVAHGRKPGVYDKWEDAQIQIKGYPLPVYRGFVTRTDAEKFVRDRQPESYQMDADESANKFYAIARGRVVGIFTDYREVVQHSKGSPNMLQKKFDSIEEAREFIRKYTTPLDPETVASRNASHRKKGPVFYGVARGRETGVFTSWDVALEHTKNFKGALVRKFTTEDGAQNFVDENKGKTVETKPRAKREKRTVTKPKKKKVEPEDQDDDDADYEEEEEDKPKKKKKSHHATGGQPGFIAVAHGKKPGVYDNWADAQEQMKGYPMPIYKRCTTREEAEKYIADRQPDSYHLTVDNEASDRFYAIARGRVVGIFTEYSEVIQHSRGSPNMLWKKFDTLEEAREYLDLYMTHFDTAKTVTSPRLDESTRSSHKKKIPVFYGVASGRRTGVFNTWEEVLEQTKGYKGASVRKFLTEDEALRFSLGIDPSPGSGVKRGAREERDEENGEGSEPSDGDADYVGEPSTKKSKKRSQSKRGKK